MSIAWAILLIFVLITLGSARRCSNPDCRCLMWCSCGGSCCKTASVWSSEGMTNRDKTVILYTRPDCVYCNQFMPTWEDLKRALIPHGYQFVEYNGQIVPSADVKTFPTIFLIDNGGHKLRFEGVRTFENLRTWILANRH